LQALFKSPDEMLKRILIGLSVFIGIALAALLAGAHYLNPDKQIIAEFIEKNPEKCAILVLRNGEVVASQNTGRVMPLASTVKIIVAIEYAEQAASGKINAEEPVSLDELEKFHIPNTDGGAHTAWLAFVAEKIENGKIPLREVAKGMNRFSSNANTEFLMAHLDLENINAQFDQLEIKQHTPIYYFVSSLFVSKHAFPGLSGNELELAMKSLSTDDYIDHTMHIHNKLQSDSAFRNQSLDLNMALQRIWSDNLPASTVEDYVGVMKKINSKKHFSAEVHDYLDEVLEYIMEQPANRQWLKHSGMKGGTTAFVLTKALYATDVDGNTTEMAYFFNDLNLFEIMRLQLSLNDFELNVLNNSEFRNELHLSLNTDYHE